MNGVAKGIINDQLGVHLHLLVQHSQGLARICTQIMPGTEGTVCACRLIAGSHRVWGAGGWLAFSVPARLPGVAAFIKTGFAGVYVA